jgi:hypothetical protein
LNDDFKLTTFGDEEMMNQIIYNTKPLAYQMQLTVIKNQLAMEAIRFDKDNSYVKEVTLESVQVKFREMYATIQASKTRSSFKDTPVRLLSTNKKKFPKQFRKNFSLCGKQCHKSVDCYSRPENAHKKPGYKAAALITTSSTTKSDITCHCCNKKGHTEKQRFKKKREEKDEKVNVMLMAIEHILLNKGMNNSFTSNSFIAKSGATCHMRGSLEGMLNLKPYVTDIMVGNNEAMSSVSMGNCEKLVLKPDGSTMDLTLKDVLYIPKLMVNLFSLTNALETKGVQLSSKGQLISLKIGTHEIFFDMVFKHGSRQPLGIQIHPNPNHIAATAQTLDINTVHNMFGHPDSQVLVYGCQVRFQNQDHTLCLFQLCRR